jgi:hypothetical protein
MGEREFSEFVGGNSENGKGENSKSGDLSLGSWTRCSLEASRGDGASV